MEHIQFYADIVKIDLNLRQIAGWSNVYAIDGNPVIDRQGDLVEEAEVRKAAHRFMREHRVVKAMHDGAPIGHAVESVLIDDTFAQAQGITHGIRGWWVGIQIDDEATWARVKAGEFGAFSVGGRGKREVVI